MAPKPVHVAVVGTGGVGAAFLQQLSGLVGQSAQGAGQFDIRVALIARSKTAIHAASPGGSIELSSWADALASSKDPAPSMEELAASLTKLPGAAVLVDNTSSEAVAQSYPAFLSQGISVVTPNKKAFSSTQELWDAISAAQAKPGAGLCRFESSVGAGLPIICTLQDLLATGDEVRRIEGVFSGTMSFLFNTFAPADGGAGGASAAWSATVREAQRLGYTEPDPRDDLNGLDVARKLTILARLCSVKIAGPAAFPVESLVPKELEGAKDGAEFLDGLPRFDADMEKKRAEAASSGKVLRFVGSLDVAASEPKVGLELVERGSPIAGLKGSDNIISFYTRRYGDKPLVVQGAGAGGDVTAMGVTADLIKVLQRIS